MLGKRVSGFIGIAVAVLMLLPAATATAEATAAAEATAPAPVSVPAPVSAPQPSTPTSAIPTVGVLSMAGHGSVGTGTVINTAKGNIVLTAAHPFGHPGTIPPASAFTFTPGYSPGTNNPAPYGVWHLASYQFMPQRGISHNPDYDTALLVLDKNSQGQNIQDVVGGQNYQLNAPITGPISSVGYPTASPGPLYCQVNATVHTVNGHKDEFQADCDKSFGDGVSGTSFMTNYDPQTQQGTVVADVGGDNEGGDPSEELTYGVRLDNGFQAFLDDVTNA